MERLDIFEEDFTPSERGTATIDEVHREGLWHQTFACWLINKEKKTIFLQLRGPKNRIDPGSFDASASGHLAAGEKPEDGFREVSEELGITIAPCNTHYLGLFRNIAKRGTYINREFCHVFFAEHTLSLSDITPERGEVSGIFEARIEDLLRLFLKQTDSITIQGLQKDNPSTPHHRELSRDQMCNPRERFEVTPYYPKIALNALSYATMQEKGVLLI